MLQKTLFIFSVAALTLTSAAPVLNDGSAAYQKEDKALRDLYVATGGPQNWRTECDGCKEYPYTKGEKWGGTNNHCEWFGVECVHPWPVGEILVIFDVPEACLRVVGISASR